MSTLIIVKFCNVSRGLAVSISRNDKNRFYQDVSPDRAFEINRIVRKADNEGKAIIHPTRSGVGYSARITGSYA